MLVESDPGERLGHGGGGGLADGQRDQLAGERLFAARDGLALLGPGQLRPGDLAAVALELIPGQSQNEIVRIPDPVGLPSGMRAERPLNESSGPTYRHVDFVVDLPLRIDSLVSHTQVPELERLGSVIYAMAEFQIVDRRTARDNELGDNSHQAYKDRQRERVLSRLERPFVEGESEWEE